MFTTTRYGVVPAQLMLDYSTELISTALLSLSGVDFSVWPSGEIVHYVGCTEAREAAVLLEDPDFWEEVKVTCFEGI